MPLAGEDDAGGAQRPVIVGADPARFEVDRALLAGDGAEGDVFGALVHALDGAGRGTGGSLRYLDLKTKVGRPGSQGAVPNSGELLRGLLAGCQVRGGKLLRLGGYSRSLIPLKRQGQRLRPLTRS